MPRNERDAAAGHPSVIDALIAIMLGLAAGYACLQLFQAPMLSRSNDVWFGADTRQALQAMGARTKPHTLSALHPLFVLISASSVTLLRKGLSLQQFESVALFGCSLAAFFAAALYALFRLLGVRRIDATLVTIAACSSAAALVVFVMPGPPALAAVTLIALLVLAALAERAPSSLGLVAASALGLCVQPLQVIYAGLLARLHRGVARGAAIVLAGLAIVLALGFAQKVFAPASRFPFALSAEQRQAIASGTDFGSPLPKLRAALVHSAVLPAPRTLPGAEGWNRISAQEAAIGSAGALGIAATVLWFVLLGLAAFALSRERPPRRLLSLIAIGGGLQLALVLGSRAETLPLALGFTPLLFVAIALATRSALRAPVLCALAAFIACAAPSNLAQLRYSQKLAYAQVNAPAGSERARTRIRMLERPNELWPRGEGHVVLAFPGSRESDKSYHEPGGSFSPGFDSFGVSVWGVDPKTGEPAFTSDTVPLRAIDQRFVFDAGRAPGAPPSIETKTPEYALRWSLPAPGRSRAELDARSRGAVLHWALRSAGPAGGKVTKIAKESGALVVNDRYRVTFDPAPRSIALGSEDGAGGKGERGSDALVEDDGGWGYARVELGAKGRFALEIQDLRATPPPSLPFTADALALELPDARFVASLRAQLAHLEMSLVGREPRPGDPNAYPLPWQRDGVYVLVALARAGQLDLARALATHFAEIDFFGGFGSEADAPGLAIWSLAELARTLRSPEFDAVLWPHVARKADLLIALRNAKGPVRIAPTGPVLPTLLEKDPEIDLVADAPRDGLINGRMDGHRPLLFVNAMSYRGFIDAAELGERVGNGAAAERYRGQAAEVRAAWEKGLGTSEAINPRTYISGLWPSFVAAQSADAYQRELERRWQSDRTPSGGYREPPLWTYFDIAEAHQWLFLGRADRTWLTLQWFWDHDASPGLFTLWEGGEGGYVLSSRWESSRGWLYPPSITPHYWSAAELLLLQLDMLAYLDESLAAPRIVIGAGVPARWREAPFAFSGLYAGGRQISVRFDGKRADVHVRGPRVDVELAPGWKGTMLDLTYEP